MIDPPEKDIVPPYRTLADYTPASLDFASLNTYRIKIKL